MIGSAAAVPGWPWIVDGRRCTPPRDSADRHGPRRRVPTGAARRGQTGAGVVEPIIWLVAPLPTQGREVELVEGLLDQAALVALVERLARHLLGGPDGEVGDLLADLLDRAAGLGLDVAAGLLEHLVALGLGLGEHLALVRLTGLARAGDDVVGLVTRGGQPLAVLLEQLGGLAADALRRLDR